MTILDYFAGIFLLNGVSDPKKAYDLAENFSKESIKRKKETPNVKGVKGFNNTCNTCLNMYNTVKGLDSFTSLEQPKHLKTSNSVIHGGSQKKKFMLEFNEFWAKFPRKIGKASARRKWETKIKTQELAQSVIEGLTRALRFWDEDGTETQFIPHPTTWLNQERWNDVYTIEKSKEEIIAGRERERVLRERAEFNKRFEEGDVASGEEIKEIIKQWEKKTL